jgi:hypothetical protein
MKNLKLIFSILLILISFSGISQNLLKGFEVLNIPRENISLGAEWINGVGANGNGVLPSNIIKSKSLNIFNSNKDFKQQIDLGILNFLGLSGDYLKNATITYKGLNIYTVADLAKTDIRSGQSILYEGIKADSINVKLNENIDASLKALIDEKIKIGIETDYNKGVSFSGDNLFLAYRVFEIGNLKIKTKEASFKKSISSIRTHRAKIMDYEITLDVRALEKCSIKLSSSTNQYGNSYLVSHLLECEKYVPIQGQIKNYSDIDFSGIPLTKTFETLNNKIISQQFGKRLNDKLISDNIEISTNIYYNDKKFYLQVSNETKVTLRRITTKLKILNNTNAPGW